METIINPRIVDQSSECVEEEEGCLSIPDYLAFITRPETILVEY